MVSFATFNFVIFLRELIRKGGEPPSFSDICSAGGCAFALRLHCDWLSHLPLIRHCDITVKWTYNMIDSFCLMITFADWMIMRQWLCVPWRWMFYFILYHGLGDCSILIGWRVSITSWQWTPSKWFSGVQHSKWLKYLNQKQRDKKNLPLQWFDSMVLLEDMVVVYIPLWIRKPLPQLSQWSIRVSVASIVVPACWKMKTNAGT